MFWRSISACYTVVLSRNTVSYSEYILEFRVFFCLTLKWNAKQVEISWKLLIEAKTQMRFGSYLCTARVVYTSWLLVANLYISFIGAFVCAVSEEQERENIISGSGLVIHLVSPFCSKFIRNLHSVLCKLYVLVTTCIHL